MVGHLPGGFRTPFRQTSFHTFSAVGTRVGIAMGRIIVIPVAVDRGKRQPVCDFDVKIEVTHKLMIRRFSVIAVIQIQQVVGGLGIYPPTVMMRNQFPVFVVRAIPRKHGIHSRYGILFVFNIPAGAADGGFDCQPMVRFVIGIEAEAVALVVVSSYRTIFIVITQ